MAYLSCNLLKAEVKIYSQKTQFYFKEDLFLFVEIENVMFLYSHTFKNIVESYYILFSIYCKINIFFFIVFSLYGFNVHIY